MDKAWGGRELSFSFLPPQKTLWELDLGRGKGLWGETDILIFKIFFKKREVGKEKKKKKKKIVERK